jgi:hypothetical protein
MSTNFDLDCQAILIQLSLSEIGFAVSENEVE